MAFVDYYKILGVDRSIPQNEVKPETCQAVSSRLAS